MIFYYDCNSKIKWIFESEYELSEIANRKLKEQNYLSSRVNCKITTNMFPEFDDDVFLECFLHIYLFKETNSIEINPRKRTITIELCVKESNTIIHLKDSDAIIFQEKDNRIIFLSKLFIGENKEKSSEVNVFLEYGSEENTAIEVCEDEINNFINSIKMLGEKNDNN